MGLGLRFQFKLSHTSEEEWVVVLFKILKFFGLLGPVHKIFWLQLILLLDNQVFVCLLKLSLFFVCVCDGGAWRLQAGSKCKHLQLHYDTLVFDDGNDCRAHKVILMNPVESRWWAGSECKHPYLHSAAPDGGRCRGWAGSWCKLLSPTFVHLSLKQWLGYLNSCIWILPSRGY